jgi:hypothetical protein
MLPYDQIPRERRAIADFTGRLGEHNDVLGVALAQWMARDDTRAEPGVRRAANTAMDEIDAMLRELHALRGALMTEIRASDDTAAARADELLASVRGRGACPAWPGRAGRPVSAARLLKYAAFAVMAVAALTVYVLVFLYPHP